MQTAPIHATAVYPKHLLHTVISFMRGNTVFCIAFSAALLSVIAVPPDAAYRDYIDLRTIVCLFCTLAVVGALKSIRFFTIAARRIVSVFGTLRSAVLALVLITFIGSMLIANDMALLTFLPLGWLVLHETGNTGAAAFTFIMQNIAANLGGMLTPFGNPQNLYLYAHFYIPTGDFMLTMAIPFAVAVLLMTVITFIAVPRVSLTLSREYIQKMPRVRLTVYLALFILSLLMVFRLVPVMVTLAAVIVVLLFLCRPALRGVDYPLLMTFVCFFIFASNLSRIVPVREALSSLIGKDPLIVSAMSCQFISNVPTAILFSRFTAAWRPLLLGVNIGGAGTLIASLASLITFREFQRHCPGSTKHYLLLFSALNFGFLLILAIVCKVTLLFLPS